VYSLLLGKQKAWGLELSFLKPGYENVHSCPSAMGTRVIKYVAQEKHVEAESDPHRWTEGQDLIITKMVEGGNMASKKWKVS
jgi:hypothetical protein